MKGLIIDGVVASGKSSIIKYLQQKLVETYPYRSKFFLSEHYTERILEKSKENNLLAARQAKQHIQNILETLQRYDEMLKKSKFSTRPQNAELILLVERFILTHFASLEDRRGYSLEEARKQFILINKYNIKQIVLEVPEEYLKERIMSTVNYRNDEWHKYLYSTGDEDQIIQRFRGWQNRLIKYANTFSDIVETIRIEVYHSDYESYAKDIFNKYLRD